MASEGTTTASENPALLAAIVAFSRAPSAAAQQALLLQLTRATYLVPILEDTIPLRSSDSEQMLAPGTGFRLLICQDPDTSEELLPIFSDLTEVKRFTDQKVSTLVLQLREVHELLARELAYAGAVVNPGGLAIPIPRALLDKLNA